MQRVTITLDDDLMTELDAMIAERGYQNRSEAIRDLTRAGLKQASIDTGRASECVGVLSYVFDHASRELSKRLTNAFHDHHNLTVSSLHVHLDSDDCVEVSILKGSTAEVQHFAEHVIAERYVRHGKLAVIPIADEQGTQPSPPHRVHT
jgi:CopG family nickel-responsive transcriptional regulator